MSSLFTRAKKLAVAGLDVLWGGLLFGGYAFGKPTPERENHIPKNFDLLSSAALVGTAWTLRSAAPHGPLRRFATRMAIGMSFGALGDVCMKRSVLAGMAAFGIGHGAYISGISGLHRLLDRASWRRRSGSWATWIGLGLLGWYLVIHKRPPEWKPNSKLAWAALGYSALLSSTAAVSCELALARPRYTPLLVGAALFVLSDLIIAMRIFNPELYQSIPDALRSDIVWLTYGPAQALIVHSVLTALCDPALERSEKPR